MTVGNWQERPTSLPGLPLPSVGFAAGFHFVLPQLSQRKIQMRKKRAFSLIELLIMVAIILTIAAISIPNLLRALNTAQISYNFYLTMGFATTLSALGRTGCARQVRVGLHD